MNRFFRAAGISIMALILAGAGFVAIQSGRTASDITALEARVAAIGSATPAPVYDERGLAGLPDPVRRYFRFTFQGKAVRYSTVRLSATGDFRRPLTERFNPTNASQVIAAGVPALMFSATTHLLPGLWARAYDFFADGDMEMKAKIMSAITVVDERQAPLLNKTSLRRWLLESALYPVALLPGGPVSWEPIDEQRSRAVVTWRGLNASMVAHFDAEGRMTHMTAEEEGDLSTPYHGSGEHVTRSNYRRIGSQMIPMDFTISRMAHGQLYPFWKGSLDAISFE